MLRATPRRLLPLLLTAAALLATAAWAAPAQKSSASKGGIAYRWVDEQGVVHYGDNIPPQYAQQDRTILNKQGVALSHVDAALTPEQAAAEANNSGSRQRSDGRHDI